jgi:hypothetical protein
VLRKTVKAPVLNSIPSTGRGEEFIQWIREREEIAKSEQGCQVKLFHSWIFFFRILNERGRVF